jgi:DNA-binding GntR family transcriptional regulator
MTDAPVLPKLSSLPSLGEQTYKVILDAIVSLEFKPGDQLSVHRLSEQLGVSRTPVKDAFQRLEQEGLVSVVPRRGTFVSPIEVKDIDEILEARALIEAFAARRAARGLSEDDLEGAEAVLERQADALEAGNIPESAEIGHGLHVLVMSQLDNERMVGFLKNMDLQYTRIRRIFAHEFNRQHQSHSEHCGILEKLQARDADGAYHAMFDHHLSVRDDLVASFKTGIREGTLDSVPAETAGATAD